MAAKEIKGIIVKFTKPHPIEGDVPEQFNIKPDAKATGEPKPSNKTQKTTNKKNIVNNAKKFWFFRSKVGATIYV